MHGSTSHPRPYPPYPGAHRNAATADSLRTAPTLPCRADVRIRNGVIPPTASNGARRIARRGELRRRLEGLAGGVRPNRRIAGIGHMQLRSDVDVEFEVIRLHILRCLPDRAGAESGTRTVRDASVIRNSVDGPIKQFGSHFGRCTIPQHGKSAERGQPGKPGGASRIRQRGATSGVLGHACMVGPGRSIGKPAKKTSRIGSRDVFPTCGRRLPPDQFHSSASRSLQVQSGCVFRLRSPSRRDGTHPTRRCGRSSMSTWVAVHPSSSWVGSLKSVGGSPDDAAVGRHIHSRDSPHGIQNLPDAGPPSRTDVVGPSITVFQGIHHGDMGVGEVADARSHHARRQACRSPCRRWSLHHDGLAASRQMGIRCVSMRSSPSRPRIEPATLKYRRFAYAKGRPSRRAVSDAADSACSTRSFEWP